MVISYKSRIAVNRAGPYQMLSDTDANPHLLGYTRLNDSLAPELHVSLSLAICDSDCSFILVCLPLHLLFL